MGFDYYTTITIGTKFTFDDIKGEYTKHILENNNGYERDKLSESFSEDIEEIFDYKINCTSHISSGDLYYYISVVGKNNQDYETFNDENSENAKTWLTSGGYRNAMEINYEKLTLTNEQKQLIKDATFKLTGKDIPIKLHVLTDGG